MTNSIRASTGMTILSAHTLILPAALSIKTLLHTSFPCFLDTERFQTRVPLLASLTCGRMIRLDFRATWIIRKENLRQSPFGMSLSMEPVLAFGQKRERKEVKFRLTQRLRSVLATSVDRRLLLLRIQAPNQLALRLLELLSSQRLLQ
jgi:hypothetical protein